METLSSTKQEDMVDVNLKSSNAAAMQSQPGAEPEILVWGGQVVMLIYQLRQTSKHTHTHKLIY